LSPPLHSFPLLLVLALLARSLLPCVLSLHWTPVLSHRTFVPWKLARLNVFVTTYFTFRCGLAPLCLFLTWRSAPLQLCALGQSPRLEPTFFGHLLSYAWSIALRFFSLRAEALRLSLFLLWSLSRERVSHHGLPLDTWPLVLPSHASRLVHEEVWWVVDLCSSHASRSVHEEV